MQTQALPWHSQVYASLAQMHEAGRLPHAVLLEGPKGLGKGLLAESLGALALCSDTQRKGVQGPCGQCKQCLLVASDTHPDIRKLSPEADSKVVKVDAVRELGEFIAKSPTQGGYKVAIVSPAEAMNVNAANALLKSLEEPTPKTLIILVYSQKGALLPTLRSRCQAFPVNVPERSLARDWLCEILALESGDEAVQSLLDLAYGAPLLAKEYADQGVVEHLDEMREQMAKVLKRQFSAGQVAERWNDDLAENRLLWLCQWAEQLVRLAMTGDESPVKDPLAKKMLRYVAEKSDRQSLFKLHQESLAQLALLQGSTNPNKVLLFESLLNQWKSLIYQQRA